MLFKFSGGAAALVLGPYLCTDDTPSNGTRLNFHDPEIMKEECLILYTVLCLRRQKGL